MDAIQQTLVYTVVLALILTAFFDLTRIAALGIIFYLAMDIAIHRGILRHLKGIIPIKPIIPVTAILLDFIVLVAFVVVKFQSDCIIGGRCCDVSYLGNRKTISGKESFFYKKHIINITDPSVAPCVRGLYSFIN